MDDVPKVAFVVVMIRSEFDERGYTVEAEGFRDYVASRIERNGTTVAVTEAADFAAILYRRLFVPAENLPSHAMATSWTSGAAGAWDTQVFERLGAGRTLAGFRERLAGSYPFSPDSWASSRTTGPGTPASSASARPSRSSPRPPTTGWTSTRPAAGRPT